MCTWARREGGRHHCRSEWACAIGLANPCRRVMCKCRKRSTSAAGCLVSLHRASTDCGGAATQGSYDLPLLRVSVSVMRLSEKGGTDKPCICASSLAAGVNLAWGGMAAAWLQHGSFCQKGILRGGVFFDDGDCANWGISIESAFDCTDWPCHVRISMIP